MRDVSKRHRQLSQPHQHLRGQQPVQWRFLFRCCEENQVRFWFQYIIATASKQKKNFPIGEVDTYAGSIDVMVCPDLAFTNSLLIKRPVGCVYLTPLGAVSSTAEALIVGSVMRDLIQDFLSFVLQWMRLEIVI